MTETRRLKSVVIFIQTSLSFVLSRKSENSFDDERLKQIKEDLNELRNRFSKPQLIEIKKNFYDLKSLTKLSTQKLKEIEENLFKLEKFLSNFKKYRYQDDFKLINIRDKNKKIFLMELTKIINGSYTECF